MWTDKEYGKPSATTTTAVDHNDSELKGSEPGGTNSQQNNITSHSATAQSLSYHTDIFQQHLGSRRLASILGSRTYFDQGLSANIRKDGSLHLLKICIDRSGRYVKSHIV